MPCYRIAIISCFVVYRCRSVASTRIRAPLVLGCHRVDVLEFNHVSYLRLPTISSTSPYLATSHILLRQAIRNFFGNSETPSSHILLRHAGRGQRMVTVWYLLDIQNLMFNTKRSLLSIERESHPVARTNNSDPSSSSANRCSSKCA